MSFLIWLLAILGAVNWGFVGLWNVDVVTMVLGSWPFLVHVVHVLIGLAGIWCIVDRIKRLVS